MPTRKKKQPRVRVRESTDYERACDELIAYVISLGGIDDDYERIGLIVEGELIVGMARECVRLRELELINDQRRVDT